jgi:hypothetical protein
MDVSKETQDLLLSSTTQLKPKGEQQWYAPQRDLSVLTPVLIGEALEIAYEDSPDDLGLEGIAVSLADFVSLNEICKSISFDDALDRSKLSDNPSASVNKVYMLLGQLLLSAFWHSARVTTTVDKEGVKSTKQYTPEQLTKQASSLAERIRMGRIRRAYSKVLLYLSRWVRKVSG